MPLINFFLAERASLLYRESEARHSAMFRSQDPFFLRYYKVCFHTLLIALKTIIYRRASGVPIKLRLCFIIFLDFSEFFLYI
jgi:hypothetical protein